MNRPSVVFTLVCILGGCAAPPSEPVPAPSDPPAQKPLPSVPPLLKDQIINEPIQEQPAEILLPTGFRAGGSDSYPLLVFFHSYEQDCHQLALRTRFPKFTANLGWILASSDLGGPSHWGNPAALVHHRAFLKRMRDHYQADPSRIYYVGFSMGGGTALLAAMEAKGSSDEPAAVVSSQGWSDLLLMRQVRNGMYASSIDAAYGGTISEAQRTRTALATRAAELSGIPLYLEHGGSDTYVPPGQSQALHSALEALNLPHAFKIHAGLDHGETTIHEGAIIEFLRDKQRKVTES